MDDEVVLACFFELRFEEMHGLNRNTLVLLANADQNGDIQLQKVSDRMS